MIVFETRFYLNALYKTDLNNLLFAAIKRGEQRFWGVRVHGSPEGPYVMMDKYPHREPSWVVGSWHCVTLIDHDAVCSSAPGTFVREEEDGGTTTVTVKAKRVNGTVKVTVEGSDLGAVTQLYGLVLREEADQRGGRRVSNRDLALRDLSRWERFRCGLVGWWFGCITPITNPHRVFCECINRIETLD